MKRMVALVLAMAMLLSLCACGQSDAPAKDTAAVAEVQSMTEEILDMTSDDPVDIYHLIMDFEDKGAEAYIAGLQEENPDKEYRYYNEEYYIETITEGERKEALEQMMDADAFFAEAFESEYPGLFIKAELNHDLDKLTFHFNRAAYEENMFVGFAVLVIGAAYMDSLGAYNLVPPEDREPHFVCVDENGEVLMDSDNLE